MGDVQPLPVVHAPLPEQSFVRYFCTSLLAHPPHGRRSGGGKNSEWIEQWGKLKSGVPRVVCPDVTSQVFVPSVNDMIGQAMHVRTLPVQASSGQLACTTSAGHIFPRPRRSLSTFSVAAGAASSSMCLRLSALQQQQQSGCSPDCHTTRIRWVIRFVAWNANC